jgi:transposase
MSASTGMTEHRGGRSSMFLRKGGWILDEARQNYRFWVGIDWGSATHQVCVLGSDGKKGLEIEVKHDGAGLEGLVNRFLELAEGDVERVAVAIEVPRGPVVESLLERGIHVFSINPKQLDRCRDRYSVAGAKDDRLDALVLADALRTDDQSRLFRRVRVDDPLVIRLREVSRLDEELGEEIGRLSSRLRDQLWRYFPQLLTLCTGANEPWLWELLEKKSTPEAARRFNRKGAEALLSKHRIRRFGAAELVGKLREPAPRLIPGAAEAAAEHVQMLLPRLQLVHRQRRDTAQRLEQILDEMSATPEDDPSGEPRDAVILLSCSGIGPRVAARLIGEASHAIGDRDHGAMRKHSGIAPVRRQTGKNKKGHTAMRYGCNQRLRDGMFDWGRSAITCDPRAKNVYAAARKRGKSHGHGLRIVGDHLLRVLFAMLRERTLFDPAKRTVCAEKLKTAA